MYERAAALSRQFRDVWPKLDAKRVLLIVSIEPWSLDPGKFMGEVQEALDAAVALPNPPRNPLFFARKHLAGGAKKQPALPGATTQRQTMARDQETPHASNLPTSVEEVAGYAVHIGYAGFDANRWWDYYQAQGWYLSKGMPMTDWRACVRRWREREMSRTAAAKSPQPQRHGDRTRPSNYLGANLPAHQYAHDDNSSELELPPATPAPATGG